MNISDKTRLRGVENTHSVKHNVMMVLPADEDSCTHDAPRGKSIQSNILSSISNRNLGHSNVTTSNDSIVQVSTIQQQDGKENIKPSHSLETYQKQDTFTKVDPVISDKKLICFDFDNTLVKGHYHNYFLEQGLYPCNTSLYNKESVIKCTEKLLDDKKTGIRNQEKILPIFKQLLEQGYSIAIVSYTGYPDAIGATLNKMGLTKEEIKSISWYCGIFPNSVGKNTHIQYAMKACKVTKISQVILVDDNIDNISKAREYGCSTIHVDDKHYDYLIPLISITNIQYQTNCLKIGLNILHVYQELQKLYKQDIYEKWEVFLSVLTDKIQYDGNQFTLPCSGKSHIDIHDKKQLVFKVLSKLFNVDYSLHKQYILISPKDNIYYAPPSDIDDNHISKLELSEVPQIDGYVPELELKAVLGEVSHV